MPNENDLDAQDFKDAEVSLLAKRAVAKEVAAKDAVAPTPKVSNAQMLEMGLDIATGAGAGAAIGFASGGPPGAAAGALWGGFFPAASIAAFGVPEEDQRSTQRAGTAAAASQIVSRLPEMLGKAALPKSAKVAAGVAGVGLEQAIEGADTKQALERMLTLGALPERLDDIMGGISRHGKRMQKKIVDFISPKDPTEDILAVMKNAPDFRFGTPRGPHVGEKGVPRNGIVVDIALPQLTGGQKTKIIFDQEEIRKFRSISSLPRGPKAAAKMFDDPVRFAAAMQSIDDVPTQAAVRTEWFLQNVLKNPKRLDPGDLEEAVKAFGPDNIQLALGPNFMDRIGDIEAVNKLVPVDKSIGGKARGVVNYVAKRAGYVLMTGGTFVAQGGALANPTTLFISVPAILYGAAISPHVTKLLASAAKENNILKARGVYNELIQLGFREVPGEDGSVELAPPANTVSNPQAEFYDMTQQSQAAGAF